MNVILPVVLYGYVTWSDIREEYGWRVFWNRMLRNMFGLEREQVTG
jgi:hypothetical protein